MADDATPGIGVNVKLEYGEALANLEAFKQAVAGIETSGAQMGSTVKAFQQVNAQLGSTLGSFSTLAAEMNRLSTASQAVGESSTRQTSEAAKAAAAARQAATEQRAAAAQQLRDAQYINSSLQQRTAILSRLAAAQQLMRGTDGNVNEVGQAALNRRFGQLAQQELAGGKLPDMANATAAIENQAAAAKALADQTKQASVYQEAMAKQGNVMTAQFLANKRTELETAEKAAYAEYDARSRAAAAYEKSMALQGNKMMALFLEEQREQAAASEAYERAMAAQNDVMTAKFLRNKQMEGEAAEKAAARELAAQEKAYAAAKNFNNALELRAQKQDERQQAEAALAAETARISLYEFQERTLEKQLATLIKIRGIEASSIAAGAGDLSQNAPLANRVSTKYGAGALTAYRAGQLPVIQDKVDAAANTPAADPTAGSKARISAAREESAALRDLHGAARGLAGPSGLLWLTYGSMLPLAAGAGLAGGIGSGIKKGGQFEENMAFVRQLSQDSAPSLEALNQQIDDISKSLLDMGANGRFGATQLSQSMRTLAQAGFNSQQSQQILPAVTNLSVIGETAPEQSALSIAGSLSAFGLGADQANRVADVLALSAAKSQTGVAQLMESMKQASSVAQDYGATIEETSAVLTLLAQRNVVGSAAGTAFRNMLVDLAGRTPKATKALQELGVSFYDTTTGRARDTVSVLGDLITKLSGMNQQMQNFYGKQIFDERGLRAFSAVAGAGQVNFSNLVGQLQGASDNGGFAQRSADQLNTTPIAEYQKAFNSLESSLIEGFQQSETEMKNFAVAMQGAFKSDEFKGFVSDVSTGTAAVLDFVRAHAGLIESTAKLAALYATYKIAIGAVTLFGTAAGVVSTVTKGLSGSLVAAQVAQLEYNAAMAAGATRSAAMGAAATYAGIGVRGLWAALGPIAIAAAVAAAAWELFANSAQAATKKIDINMDSLRNADSFRYDEMKQSYTSTLNDMMAASGSYATGQVKTMDDVVKKLKIGQQDLADFSKKVLGQQGEDNLTAKQYLIDQEADYYRTIEDQAVRHYSGTKADQQKLAEVFATIAAERARLDEENSDLMAQRAAETAAAQIKAANDTMGAWEKAYTWIARASAAALDAEAGIPQRPPADDISGSTRSVNELVAKLIKANEKGSRLSNEDIGAAKAALSAYGAQQGADPELLQSGRNNLDMQKQIREAQYQKNYQDRLAKVPGTPANGQKPDHPGRADRSEYNASKQSVDLAKEEVSQYTNLLKLRRQLNLFTSEDAFAHERDLKLNLENNQYYADRAKIELDIQKAQKSGNADAVKTMQDNLALLEVQHQNKLQNLDLDYQADRLQRDINKSLQEINVTLSASESIMRAMEDMYGSTAGFQTADLSRQAELAAITKARYEQAKEMEALSDAPAEVRALATEKRRWELANQIYKIRQDEGKLLFDNATTAKEVAQSYLDAIDESVAKLKSQQTTFSQASVAGLSNGTQDAWKGLFTYVKNPDQYKQNNNGQSFGLGTALGTIGGGIFDSISNSLANSLTTSMMTGLSDALKSAGLISQADAAREEAQRNVAQNTANMAASLGAGGAAITALNQIQAAILSKPVVPGADGSGTPGYRPGYTSEGGETFAVPGTGASLDGSSEDPAGVGKVTDATQTATDKMAGLGDQTRKTFDFMGQSSTQMFGLMYMGVNAYATGGIQAFKKFASAAIAQLLLVYAIQKLVQAASSAFGGASGGGVAEAMPVNMGDSITMTPLAGGGVPKQMPAYAMGEGSVDRDGILHGPGGPKEDKIAAALSPGEGILNAEAVKFYGKDTVNAMNKRQMRRFAGGGTLGGPSSGGGAFSGGNQYNFEMNFHGSGDKDQGAGKGDQDKQADALAERIKAVVIQTVQEESRPGGVVNVTVKKIASGKS